MVPDQMAVDSFVLVDFDSKLTKLACNMEMRSGVAVSPKHVVSSSAAPPAVLSRKAGNEAGSVRPTSLFSIVSQKSKNCECAESTVSSEAVKLSRKVMFDDNVVIDGGGTCERSAADGSNPVAGVSSQSGNDGDDDGDSDAGDDTMSDDSECEADLVKPKIRPPEDFDDLSLSAFVSPSVRRQSIMPVPRQASNADTSVDSLDSFTEPFGAQSTFCCRS